MIKAENLGIIHDENGDAYYDIFVSIEPPEVDYKEFAAIVNEMKCRGVSYETINNIINNVYNTEVIERTVEEETLNNFRN